MPPRNRTRSQDESRCRARVVQAGTEFEFEGPETFVLAMLDRFGGGAPATMEAHPKPATKAAAKDTARPSGSASPSSSKSMSLGEFVRQLGFKRHTDLVLAFGFYLEKMRGVSEFTAADMNNCYYEAKLDTSNTSQMVIQNIKRGFMMEGKNAKGSRRAYTLTRSGEEYVEAALSPAEK